MKRGIAYILLTILFISLVLVGCNSNNSNIKEASKHQQEINQKDEEIEELKNIINSKEKEISDLMTEKEMLRNKLSSKESDIKYLTEEVDYYRKFIDSILTEMTEDELIEIAKNEVWYTLKFKPGKLEKDNDNEYTPVPKDGKIEVNESNFLVTLSERQTMHRILSPKEYPSIYEKVRIDKYTNHIKIKNYSNYEVQPASGTIVDANTYCFKDVPKGTVIEIEITEQLQKRLGLKTRTVKISVK
ncbi:hypothetical protein [Caldisalinibacter kiritimatiensis]|uniref:Lipoprotein n=1 Tax=Caldisalinibacter kiritimatiensis TaxID=1304284 RepID=R1AVC6_9FIRM|nr:hypothetical protein [Caldisalinibacter kiritimatiensis]EOD01158.1 hypothetical protein L21TH_0763 [Caldisalinibacter kiritimatiensis]